MSSTNFESILASLFVSSGYNPSSALDAVLLVVLEHASICEKRGGEEKQEECIHTSPSHRQ